jgi:glycosyltransferase involved in cell wall biosynthesis/ubiquinone/menaquinone biosynthesis C-methylase UbiE
LQQALHIFHVSKVLADCGVDAVIAVTADAATIDELGPTKAKAIEFPQAFAGDFGFSDGGGPDIVHAWTPREHVRELTEHVVARFGCPYIVHLEDNEQAVTEDELFDHPRRDWQGASSALIDVMVAHHRSHPILSQRFMENAAGATVLLDRLAEHLPAGIQHITFWPGFDAIFTDLPPRQEARASFGIPEDETALVYTGNIHWSNISEIQSLVMAVALLRREGMRVRLYRTGFSHAPVPWDGIEELKSAVVELGFLPRQRMPELLAAADVLAQPGESNRFNDFRIPSKLPEFLASGRPVILPRSNLGRFLKDGEEAIILESGKATELAKKIRLLAGDPELAERLGKSGRQFAMERLNWEKTVPPIYEFYQRVLADVAQKSGRSGKSAPVRSSAEVPVKLIAFYLPQFHPIPENDKWWEMGFTEWTNVRRAKPNFGGHVQPNLPAELGFYDLRDSEVMEKQTKLAREHGIFGFCYYYYWFNGKRLLEMPVDRMLASGQPDFPFCLCWANENWTRRWDGQDSEVLMHQDYSEAADEQFIRDILPFLRDRRYIRVNGKPLLMVYRIDKLPDAKSTAERWRRVAGENGLPGLHLTSVQSFGIGDPRGYGFDASVEFPPHMPHKLIDNGSWPGLNENFAGYLEDYVQTADEYVKLPAAGYPWYRGVMPGWDNTPRRMQAAHIYVHSSPQKYQKWLRQTVGQTLGQPGQAPLVFVNSWNEWAEGAQLEPDQWHGRGNLDATLRGLGEGIADDARRRRFKANVETIIQNIKRMAGSAVSASSDLTFTEAVQVIDEPVPGFTKSAELEAMAARYEKKFKVPPLSYATVSDFCDSVDHLQAIATASGDLKDVQRPWMLKAILGHVPRGGRLLEIGAGEPVVADLLNSLGYEVWIVDPYDGSGNGPQEFERFRDKYPNLRFIRDLFSDRLNLEEKSFDCIYSISVLEHVPTEYFPGVFAGLKKFLKADGLSLHAVDHVHKGQGDSKHLAKLRLMVEGFGLGADNLDRMLEEMRDDAETYYLSAESHNRWRGKVKYTEFPMRVCVSIQTCGLADMVAVESAPPALPQSQNANIPGR